MSERDSGTLVNSRKLHTTKILRLSEDLPVFIEIVRSEQKISTLPLPTARQESTILADDCGIGRLGGVNSRTIQSSSNSF
jgi:PII-like signaling protein